MNVNKLGLNQFKMASTRSVKPIFFMRSAPSLQSEVSPAFQCWCGLTLAVSRPFQEDLRTLHASFLRLSPPGDRWRDVLGFVCWYKKKKKKKKKKCLTIF